MTTSLQEFRTLVLLFKYKLAKNWRNTDFVDASFIAVAADCSTVWNTKLRLIYQNLD